MSRAVPWWSMLESDTERSVLGIEISSGQNSGPGSDRRRRTRLVLDDFFSVISLPEEKANSFSSSSTTCETTEPRRSFLKRGVGGLFAEHK